MIDFIIWYSVICYIIVISRIAWDAGREHKVKNGDWYLTIFAPVALPVGVISVMTS